MSALHLLFEKQNTCTFSVIKQLEMVHAVVGIFQDRHHCSLTLIKAWASHHSESKGLQSTGLAIGFEIVL